MAVRGHYCIIRRWCHVGHSSFHCGDARWIEGRHKERADLYSGCRATNRDCADSWIGDGGFVDRRAFRASQTCAWHFHGWSSVQVGICSSVGCLVVFALDGRHDFAPKWVGTSCPKVQGGSVGMVAGFSRGDVLCHGGGTHSRRNCVSRVFIDTRGGVGQTALACCLHLDNRFHFGSSRECGCIYSDCSIRHCIWRRLYSSWHSGTDDRFAHRARYVRGSLASKRDECGRDLVGRSLHWSCAFHLVWMASLGYSD